MTTLLREIVHRLGGDLYAGGNAACVPGPGHSRRDRSLSLKLTEAGRVVWHSHANDDPSAVWAHLGIERADAKPMSREEAERARRERERQRQVDLRPKLDFCRGIWSGTQSASGSPVEVYLRGRAVSGDIPQALRFHPAAPLGYPDPSRPSRPYPAMVAVVTGPDGKSAIGLHVTALQSDGSDKAKLPNTRRMFGEIAGGVVQLSPFPSGGELAIAEGIETALSYRDLSGTPTWAGISTSLLRRFSPPLGIKRLIIAADGDAAGVEAARELAERASRRCECVVNPAPEGFDWNDVARGRAR